ncbi:hypothetical protein [Undibacterium squillarum]|jgi:hypothetical protein|uniref:hypothetical protein n=1 Tax=Undibacterium squillarum TaxID=1131567 RepID=UPI0035B4BFDD
MPNLLPVLRRLHRRSRHWLMWLLLPALLLGQWTGFTHKLVHAGWQNGKVQTLVPQSGLLRDLMPLSAEDSLLHSCALTDASFAADYLHFTPPVFSVLTVSAVMQAFPPQIIWLASLRLAFSSRAPPAN